MILATLIISLSSGCFSSVRSNGEPMVDKMQDLTQYRDLGYVYAGSDMFRSVWDRTHRTKHSVYKGQVRN